MTETILSKTCSKCQETKPVSEFYKDPKGTYHSWCRPCCAEYARKRYKTHKNEINARSRIYYERNSDVINAKHRKHRKDNLEHYKKKDRERNKKRRYEQSIKSKEYREKNEVDLAEKRKIKYNENPELFKERGRKQYQIHKEERKERQRKYNKTHKKEIAERDKKYRAENKEAVANRQKKYSRANSKKLLEYQKEYRQTEKGKSVFKKASHKHRALKIGATVEDFSPIEIFERDNYICQICGIKTRPDFKDKYHPKYPHLDHVVPLSLGGAHSKLNTQTLCRQCNIEKSNTGKGDQLRLFG